MIPRDTAKYIHIYRASLKSCLPMVRKNTECLGTKGQWPLPRPLTPKLRQREVLCRVTLKHSQNFCTVQQTSIVSNQSEGCGISGSWSRQTHRCQQQASIQLGFLSNKDEFQLAKIYQRKTFCLYSFASREQSRLYHNQNIELQR